MNTTKESVIDILIDNSQKYVSGEYISEQLGLSRASIWKHINSLRKEGFLIDSKNGLGYKLVGKSEDSPTQYEIKYKLDTSYIGQSVHYFKSIDSTNIYANKIAEKSNEGTVVISDEQKNGKGRSGKKWDSSQEEGIYFSLILKPNIPIYKASFLTQVAGAAMILSLEKFRIEPQIKWPNDIVLNNKKICGILTEMSAEIENISHIIVGIGINISNKTFPSDLINKATSILAEGYKIDKIELLRTFFVEFEKLYDKFKKDDNLETLSILKNKSAVIGRDIFVITRDSKKKVYAKDIDNTGNLVIVNEDGSEETIFSGEISIRGLDSYI
ncbi:biotin--[acetyl-CoA-carboxylase] ligase [Peptostreptococcus faecalis]|uniref:biotin--[acetyl-CoA-carboxylase] ligase n=1 Tax=Peptostreptococcus faecalis TaxID=2045015 RepID=UPI000C7AC015|nr:biotin--[acetyl-CoA-carboxylase] ligase [Peptostreptococcus faecalis]